MAIEQGAESPIVAVLPALEEVGGLVFPIIHDWQILMREIDKF